MDDFLQDDELPYGKTMATMRGGDGKEPVLARIDKFDLLERKGGGAFGVVYRARDTFSGEEVAIKTLHPLLKCDEAELERVRANFLLVAKLFHPNIAAAKDLHRAEQVSYFDEKTRLDMKVAAGDPVLVLSYASGVPLRNWVVQFPGRAVPFDKARSIAEQTADALDSAHAEKIIHRDIKPENIMIETRKDGSPRVRVLDFGLAAEIHSSMGRLSRDMGSVSGTRPYMAPEQWTGKRQDGRSDQYALACVLYEMISGEPPFAAAFGTGDVVVMKSAVLDEMPESIEKLDDGRNAVLRKALSKSREDRFETCRAFCAAFGDPGAEGFDEWADSGNEEGVVGFDEVAARRADQEAIAAASARRKKETKQRIAANENRRRLEELNDCRNMAEESFRKVDKFRKAADGEFLRRFERIDANWKILRAFKNPGDVPNALKVLAEIQLDVQWILRNHMDREILRRLQSELDGLSNDLISSEARSFCSSICGKADLERKEGEGMLDRGDFSGAREKFENAKSLFSKAISEDKRVRIQGLMESAREYFENEDWEDCRRTAGEVLSLDSTHKEAKTLWQQADAHLTTKKVDQTPASMGNPVSKRAWRMGMWWDPDAFFAASTVCKRAWRMGTLATGGSLILAILAIIARALGASEGTAASLLILGCPSLFCGLGCVLFCVIWFLVKSLVASIWFLVKNH